MSEGPTNVSGHCATRGQVTLFRLRVVMGNEGPVELQTLWMGDRMSGDLIYTQQVLFSRAARWTARSIRPKTTTVHFGQVENADEQRNVDVARRI